VRSWNKLLALAAVVGVILAAAVILALPRASIAQDTIVIAILAIVLASLVGSYALRRHARRTLLYDRATPASDSDDAGSDEPQRSPPPMRSRTATHHHVAEERS
jgi:ABC-type nickel/cobalt efflux system permease component RcnA